MLIYSINAIMLGVRQRRIINNQVQSSNILKILQSTQVKLTLPYV